MPLTLPTAPFNPAKLISGGKCICVFTPSAPTAQVETATVAGVSVSTGGNLTVTVTGAGITGSPVALTVAVVIGDSLAAVAQKIRIAIANNAPISALYTVGLSLGTTVVLTAISAVADDATLNIAISLGSVVGPTAAPTSVTTVAGSTGGTAINIAGKMLDFAYKTDTVERKVPGTDGVMRPDRQMIKEAQEAFEVVDIEEMDDLILNMTSFTGLNRPGFCTIWIIDQNDPAGVSVRLKSNNFSCSLTVKSGTTKFGGGDFSKASYRILSLHPSGVTWTPNATS